MNAHTHTEDVWSCFTCFPVKPNVFNLYIFSCGLLFTPTIVFYHKVVAPSPRHVEYKKNNKSILLRASSAHLMNP